MAFFMSPLAELFPLPIQRPDKTIFEKERASSVWEIRAGLLDPFCAGNSWVGSLQGYRFNAGPVNFHGNRFRIFSRNLI
jgi:hypothetical protein